jgi:hypothetical protein
MKNKPMKTTSLDELTALAVRLIDEELLAKRKLATSYIKYCSAMIIL